MFLLFSSNVTTSYFGIGTSYMVLIMYLNIFGIYSMRECHGCIDSLVEVLSVLEVLVLLEMLDLHELLG